MAKPVFFVSFKYFFVPCYNHVKGKALALGATAFLLVFLLGCTNEILPFPGGGDDSPEDVPVADDSAASPEKVEAVVNANNGFAFDLYAKYKDQFEGENVFFSPYSISTALAMTCEGARGKTAEEMQSVLYFPKDEDVRRPGFARIYNQINKEGKEYRLSTANALWAQKDYKFLDEYFTVVESFYGGKATNMDFGKDPEGSRQTINNWVEEKTNNKIKDLIPAGVLLTRLVLTNAIYFKGTWVSQFDEEKTREEDFRVDGGKTVKAEMMYLKDDEAEFNYAETDDLQLLEMDYKGEDLSMIVILPKEGSLEKVEEMLSAEKLAEWKEMMHEREVDIFFPKFKFETKYFMAQDLSEMGMPSAFGGADFSGMTGNKNLFISEVIHQAFVEVNEKGTEAAAATAVIIKEMISMPTVFRADHPFIFLIQQKQTGNILFLGKVMDPAK